MEEKPGFGLEGRPEEKWGNRTEGKAGNGTEERTELGAAAAAENPSGQALVLERFVDTLQKQDDVKFMTRKIVKWMCFCASIFTFCIPAREWTGLRLIAVNILSVGLLSMLYTIDFPVAMKRGAAFNLYWCLRYFPVGRREIYLFLRKRLLRFLGLYGGLAVLLQLIAGALTDSLGPGSLIFPLGVLAVMAAVGFLVIRAHMAKQYKKQVRSL